MLGWPSVTRMEWIAAVAALALVGVLGWAQARRRHDPNAELAELFGEPRGAIPGPKARTWALGVLYEAGVDADADQLDAMKALREAEPRLSLAAARALVHAIV